MLCGVWGTEGGDFLPLPLLISSEPLGVKFSSEVILNERFFP